MNSDKNAIMHVATSAILKASRALINAENIKLIKRQELRKRFMENLIIKIEKNIISMLHRAFSRHHYIGLTSGEHNNKESEYTWYINAINGSENFLHGIPHCCLSVIMKFRNTVEIAVIYNPYLDQLFRSTKGCGAQLNSHRIRVSQTASLEECVFSKMHSVSEYESYPTILLKLQKKIKTLRYSGSTLLDICYVAAGFLDGIWITEKTKVLNLEAALLILKESGGIITSLLKNCSGKSVLIGGNSRIITTISEFVNATK